MFFSFRSLLASVHNRTFKRVAVIKVFTTLRTSSRACVHSGGTRFIGVYLSRMLVEQGHDVTLYTRGKKDVTYKTPDDTDEAYENFKSKVKHIAGDRKNFDEVKQKLSGQNFQGMRTRCRA